MFPGASIKERLWPIDRWKNVADALWKLGRQSIIIGGRAEIDMSQEIMDVAKGAIINLCGRLSLSETAALFDRSRLLISTDSGILHIGAMCNIPTVSLFGPSFADKWGPKGERHRIINKELPCGPCTKFGTTSPCPNKQECMNEITSGEVIDAGIDLLKEISTCAVTHHEKEKNYHESTKYRKHEREVSGRSSFFQSYFVFSYLRVFVIDFE